MKRRNNKGVPKPLVIILSVLLSAVTACSGYMIWSELCERQKEKEAFDALARLVQAKPDTPESESESADVTEEPQEPSAEEAVAVHKWDISALLRENGDCIGWLCIADTALDYPLMHTPDNPQKYLRRDFYGSYSQSGVPFLDGRCAPDGDNLIVYGHNMKSGAMFACIKNYTDSEYYTAHPVIELETESGCAYYTVFAVAKVHKTDEWYSFLSVNSEAEYDEWVEYIKDKSLYDTNITPVYGEQLLTLSTCYGSGSDSRLVVIGAKTNADE